MATTSSTVEPVTLPGYFYDILHKLFAFPYYTLDIRLLWFSGFALICESHSCGKFHGKSVS